MPPSSFLFIIGAPKCGTSSVASWLGARDDAVVGYHKEPGYFTDFARRPWAGPASDGLKNSIITNESDYFRNFALKPDASLAIDASTDYLWNEGTAERIKDFSTRITSKVVCIVRDPIDRAISEYNHTLRHGWEEESFGRSLELEDERISRHWHPLFYHRRRSTVQADIREYHRLFGSDLLVLDYAELKEPNRLLERLARFLGIPPLPASDTARANVSLLPRNRLAKAAASSDRARRLARALVAPKYRQKIWNILHKPSHDLKTTSASEEQALRNLLDTEIAACCSDPMIPTSNWTKAVGLQTRLDASLTNSGNKE